MHTTDLLEGPSGSTIHLRGNGESYTSSPSFGYDGDTINDTQLLWTMDMLFEQFCCL